MQNEDTTTNEVETDDQKIICLNMKTGVLYKTNKTNAPKLDLFQLPLKGAPSKNCKHCYGRGYVGRDVNLNYYSPCRCVRKMVDIETMNDIKKAKADNFEKTEEGK